MKQYDKIGYLVSQEERIAANGKGESYRPIEGYSLIVLSVGELREVFKAGIHYGTDPTDLRDSHEAFNTYLTSKGITI